MRAIWLPAVALLAVASCSKSSTTTPPSTAPAPTPAPSSAPAGRGGAPGTGGRGTPLTPEQTAARRDSIGRLRGATVAQVLASLGGRDSLPATQVFKNVQILKDLTAKQLVVQMDSLFGRGLSLNCNGCHIANDWASDSLGRKRTARAMADVMYTINKTDMAKLNRQRLPQVTCVTCHRGYGNTAQGRILP